MTPENDNTNSRDGGHEEVLHILIDVLIGTHHHEVTSQTELAEALQESNTEKVRIYWYVLAGVINTDIHPKDFTYGYQVRLQYHKKNLGPLTSISFRRKLPSDILGVFYHVYVPELANFGIRLPGIAETSSFDFLDSTFGCKIKEYSCSCCCDADIKCGILSLLYI
jgi:hypothetical protein